MGSETGVNLPVIDFSNPKLKPGSPEWKSATSQVFKALEVYGCFEAVFDKVSEEVRNAAFDASKEFFDLPLEIKKKAMHPPYFDGYSSLNTAESMGMLNAGDYDSIDHYAKSIWSDGNSNFTKNMHTYTDQISELDKMVRRMVIERLGIEEYMDEHMNSTYYKFRFSHYSPPESQDIVAPVHKDHSMITVIYQNAIDGLEFLTKDGEWVMYKPSSPNSYAVLTGESITAWTNGRLYCPPHRVSLGGEIDRYSLILFGYPNKGYTVKTPPQLVDENHPLLFKPFDHSDFLDFLHSAAGDPVEKQKSPLKAYCGV